jgi:oligosaccharide repeat unit polymerase
MIWIILGGIFSQQKNKKSTWKVLFAGVSGILLFIVIFILAGFFRGWRTNKLSIWYNISQYTGGSIPALNDYLLNPRPPNGYFGENTLFGIYSLLRKLGFNYPAFYPPYEFTRFYDMGTNVYTAIRRYLEDYGYFGLYLIMMFLGFFYSLFFLIAKKRNDFLLLLYAGVFFPIVELSIEERFLTVGMTATNFFFMFVLALTYYVIINAAKNRKDQQPRPKGVNPFNTNEFP